MAMYRLHCKACGWATVPHYRITDCYREKESDHLYGYKLAGALGFPDAHVSAFSGLCPKCGCFKVEEEHRYFTDAEILETKRRKYPFCFDH